MSVEEDTGDVLEYLYLHQGTPVSADQIFDASALSHDRVRAALDERAGGADAGRTRGG